jgi:quercetin dioxygenase-like cupin family protein
VNEPTSLARAAATPATTVKGADMHMRRHCVLACSAALSLLVAAAAGAAEVKELFTKNLADYPGKEGEMIEVTYPPGAKDMVHRHNAHAFVYILEGEVIMQLQGQPAVRLKAGQTFYEGPNDVHVVGRNASKSKPAKFVVVLLKNTGAPVLTPVEPAPEHP